MTVAIQKLKELYPNKIVYNISHYPDLYCALSNEARTQGKSLKEYISEDGFAYGHDATILKLETDTENTIRALNKNPINATLLNESNIYNSVYRLAAFYDISIKDYITQIGYEYIKNTESDSNLDYETARKLNADFNLSYVDIGEIVGLSRQRIEQIFKKGNKSTVSWITSDFSNVYDIFKYMIKSHIFHTHINETRFLIIHNDKKEICFLWYDEIFRYCTFCESIPPELISLIEREKMNLFYEEDYLMLDEIQAINKLKKPYLKTTNTTLFHKARKKHLMTSDEYANFLGYSGYITEKDVITDRRIIEFFEDNLIDGEVYISADPSNQWIKSFISRSNMTIEDFVEFYGYKKASRGKFATLFSHISAVKEKLRQELEAIAVDGFVQPQGNLYQRLNIFAKKQSLSMNELVTELGFSRKRERIVDKIALNQKLVFNDLEELEKDINVALRSQATASSHVEKTTHIIERDIKLVKRLKNIYSYKCQLCNNDEWVPIQMDNETFYCEVHHIIPLAEGVDEEVTLDSLHNMIVVCPNHHKILHYHKGGFRKIIEENEELFFVNEGDEKLKVISNYHLKHS